MLENNKIPFMLFTEYLNTQQYDKNNWCDNRFF